MGWEGEAEGLRTREGQKKLVEWTMCWPRGRKTWAGSLCVTFGKSLYFSSPGLI